MISTQCCNDSTTMFSSLQVLSVKVGDEPSPHLALLEAASVSSAHLSCLSLTLTLQVEKLMALGGQVDKSPASCIGVSLQAFKDRAAKAVLAQTRDMAQQRDQGEAGLLSLVVADLSCF